MIPGWRLALLSNAFRIDCTVSSRLYASDSRSLVAGGSSGKLFSANRTLLAGIVVASGSSGGSSGGSSSGSGRVVTVPSFLERVVVFTCRFSFFRTV